MDFSSFGRGGKRRREEQASEVFRSVVRNVLGTLKFTASHVVGICPRRFCRDRRNEILKIVLLRCLRKYRGSHYAIRKRTSWKMFCNGREHCCSVELIAGSIGLEIERKFSRNVYSWPQNSVCMLSMWNFAGDMRDFVILLTQELCIKMNILTLGL